VATALLEPRIKNKATGNYPGSVISGPGAFIKVSLAASFNSSYTFFESEEGIKTGRAPGRRNL
jgi:hypothetical protein